MKKPRKRKTTAEKLDSIVLRALAGYGEHCLLCGQKGWLPMSAHPTRWTCDAARSIRRVLREAGHKETP